MVPGWTERDANFASMQRDEMINVLEAGHPPHERISCAGFHANIAWHAGRSAITSTGGTPVRSALVRTFSRLARRQPAEPSLNFPV